MEVRILSGALEHPQGILFLAKDWQSSIDIVLRRFAEYHDLEDAFGRRARLPEEVFPRRRRW
ncbi:MAG: hypothetical protein M3Z95_06215 [Actinomycetota bacterium]|nr:hypothetical protein [Actinomycetota bacterium]